MKPSDMLKANDLRVGQVVAIVAIVMPALIMLSGMAIDYGVAYVERTALSKAVDSAALESMRNLGEGNTVAQQVATDAFNANVQVLGTYSTAPTFSFSTNVDAAGNTTATITGTVYFKPLFLRIIPGFPASVPIVVTGSATRQPLYMAVVLDQSTSMNYNGGAAALPSAVTNFVNQFDDSQDHVSVVSFSTVNTVGVQMSNSPPFKSKIRSYVNSMPFNGYTFSQTGLDNGLSQINSVSLPANAAKVMVFFTDGWPNMIQDGLNCQQGSNVRTTVNFSECDAGDDALGICRNPYPLTIFSTTGGSNVSPCSSSYNPAKSWMSFYSHQSNSYVTIGATNQSQSLISNESFYRAEASATTALNQSVQIYSIGMGSAITTQPQAQQFLQEVANDPSSPTFNASLPQGEALFAPTAAQLNGVFQQIASKVLLRLLQ